MSELNQESSMVSYATGENKQSTDKREMFWAVVYCCLSAAVFFRGPLFFPRQWVIPYDIAGYHYPLSSLISWSLREFHQIPWWNPFSYMGQPFGGNLSAAIFYPPTLITVFLGNVLFGGLPYLLFETQLVAHVALAGVGTYILLRALRAERWSALTAATVYELGAFFASQTQHIGAMSSAAWLPWFIAALLRVERNRDLRSAALASLPFALLILPGFPAQYLPILFFGPLLFCIWMWQRNPALQWSSHRRGIMMLMVTMILGFLLSAASWVPGMKLAHSSAATQRPAMQGMYGMPFEAITSFVWPNLFNQLHGLAWLQMNRSFLHLYQSIPALLLVLSALPWLLRSRRAQPFLAMGVIAFLWMFGKSTFVASLFYLLYPRFIRKALYSEYLLAYFCLSFAVLAGLALQAFLDGERELPYPSKVCWRSSLAAALISLVVFIAGPVGSASSNFQVQATAAASYLVWVALVCAAAGLLLYWWEYSSRTVRRDHLAAAICALIFLDLVTIGSQTDLNTAEETRTDPPAISFLKKELGASNYRVDVTGITGEWQTRVPEWRLPSANGMDPLLLLDTERYRNPFSTVAGRVFTLTDPGSPLLDLAGVRYIVTPPQQDHLKGAALIYHNYVNVFENPRAMPRFFLVGAVHSAAEADALQAIQSRAVDVSQVALVAPEDEKLFLGLSEPAAMTRLGDTQLVKYSPNELRLRVSALRASLLVVTDTFWPEWHATIDGSPTALARVDGLFRGIRIPGGVHEVRMFIRPDSVYLGAGLSSVGLLLAFIFIMRSPGSESSATSHTYMSESH